MDCLENENVCSVKKENNLGYYRIHTIWNDNGFRINIASRDGAWTGEMKPENVQSVTNELKVDPHEYLAECKEVLTTDDGKKGYFYAVENGSFTWKKMIDEDSGMKIRMGSVVVQPASFVDTIQNIIDVALKCKKNLNKELDSLKHQKEQNLQRIHQLQERLEELCDKKNVMETDLYSKFLLLLNSKKRKIQDLEASEMVTKTIVENSKKLKHSKNDKNKTVAKEITVAEAYDLDTEDEDESHEKGNQEFLYEKYNAATEAVLDDVEMDKNRCSSYEENKKSHSACVVNIDLKSDKEMPDFDQCGGGSMHGSDNPNITPGNSKAVKDSNKSFPATKADILDFFFGPN